MGRLSTEIIKKYYVTTSSRSAAVNKDHYDHALPGLLRRLGPWSPKPGSRVLDLGCGLGEFLYLCQQLGCKELVGVNLCEDEINAARHFVNADFQCMHLLEYLRSSDQTFDWIGALNILEHLEKDEVLEVLSLVSKRLSPGGVLVAMVPNAISPFGTLTRHWDITHEWAFTPNNFLQLAAITGFDPHVEFRECGPVPYVFVSSIRWLLWQVIRIGIKAYFLIEVADTKGGVYTMDMLVRMRRERM
jgi:2-polyprenyl-3-methyl-5-hydroxy-6-metoxy-1,4-benzoquinol methylase